MENSNLEQQLASFVEKSISVGENAVQFVADQAPDVVQQLLAWHFWENAIYASVFLIPSIIMAFFIKRIILWGVNNAERTDGDSVFIMMVPVLVNLACFIFGFLANALDALKICIAPKLYLIEYVASILKDRN